VGLFADVIVRADKDRGEHSDKVEKGLRMLLASIADGAVVSCDLELDDSRVTEDLVGLEVMNVSYAGPQIPLAPEADSADGALDVVIIRPGDVAPLRAHAEARLAGAAPEPLWFDVRRAVEIHLHLPSGSILHTDDELLERGEGDEPLMVRPAAQVQVLIPGSPA
jgi:diacylglycerol kinase (ATP)